MFEFKLGEYVIDEATGFEGRINGRVVWDTGNIQYSVKPKVKESGEMGTGHWLDGDYLKAVPEKSLVSKYGEPEFQFSNGEKVKSILVPYFGRVKALAQWLNGCLEYVVVNEQLEKGATITEWFGETELESVAPPIKRETRLTGGPSSVSDRY